MNPEDLFRPMPWGEITHTVTAVAKIHRSSTEVYIPKKPLYKNEPGFETRDKIVSTARERAVTDKQELIERSLRRTRVSIKDIFFNNTFDLFVTFTFKEDRGDIDKCKSKMSGWFKRQRKADKSFQYVVVPEFHKRCTECAAQHLTSCPHDDRIKPIHFHALIKNYAGELKRAYNPNTHKPLVKKRRKVWDFPNYTLGHSEVYTIGDTEQDKVASGFYLLKYVTKDTPLFANKRRYWSSRKLQKPLIIDNPEKWYLVMEPEKTYESDYGKFLYFDNEKIDIFLPKRKAH